ncbi:MAG: multicopper oxidase domain-containing protein [Nitriliruptoraceae bacterium]
MSEERSVAMIGVSVMAAVALVLSVGALIIGASSGGRTADLAGSPAPSSIAVDLAEFSIVPGELVVAPGGSLTVTNAGSIDHDLSVVGTSATTAMLRPGDDEVLALGSLEPGTYTVICTVPGHEAGGMSASLVVSGPGSGEATDDMDHGGSVTDTDWEELDRVMDETILAFPAETAGLGNQPLEYELLADGTKRFELVAEIIEWEVEPGKIVEGWAYNGQIPGPLIRLDVGDKVEVVVTNNLPMGTDVHWHGITVPNSQDGVAPLTQDLIKPGDTFTYEFTTVEPAIGMYHPHHHGQIKLPNGMFGVMLVGDLELPLGMTVANRTVPNDLVIAQEIPMVLNDAGTIGLSLNGKSFPATAPVIANKGDWVLMHYFNEGLTIHPMHLHGFPQLVVAKDGFPLVAPQWEDTVNVAPGERYSVLIKAEHAGLWVFHCHILTHAERKEGMFGMVSAFIVLDE